MKKLFALLAVAIGVVACQKDQADFGVNLGGEQEAFITVNLPEVSRAGSESGAFENGVLNTHDLRYILEIYYGENCYRQVQYTNEKSASFPVRLAPGREYKFVVWADFVTKNNRAEDTDLFYETSNGLDEISILDGAPMTEARDAFYGNYTLAADAHVANMGAITLTRPFAKIRVVTTDIEDLNNLSVALPTEATVAYDNNVVINNKFNALTGVASSDVNADKDYTFNYANTYAVENGEMTLFADYLFVNAGATTKFVLTVTDHVTKSFNTEIPVVANQVTTIKGDILTNGSDIKVEIEDGMAAETIYLEGNVTLTENLNVNRPLVVAAGKTAVLNLNGKKIINTNPSETFGEGEGIVVYGNLTIEGEGTIQGTSMAVWARGGNGDAVVNIKGGTFVGCQEGLAKGGRSVIYASSNNTINIYGGEFKALAADGTSFATSQYPVLNIADNKGTINVYGGRFHMQNPAAPGTEPAAWNANHPNGFLADGYVSVAEVKADGKWFNVVKGAAVATADDFKAALANKDVEAVNVTNNITLAEGLDINNRGEFTVNMENNTLTSNDTFGYAGYIQNEAQVTFNDANIVGGGFQVAYGAELTFNDGSITVTTTQQGQRYCFYAYQSTVTINGGNYTFSDLYKKRSYICASGSDAVVYVYGGTFGEAPKHPSWKYPIYEDNGGQVIIYGGTFGFDPSEWVAAGYVATQNGNVWTVSKQ